MVPVIIAKVHAPQQPPANNAGPMAARISHRVSNPFRVSSFRVPDVFLQIFRPSEELQAWQAHMASLLRQQREKGGVIDPSREDDTIDETWVRSVGVELYKRLVSDKNLMVQKL